jgi:hypothetical protein
MLPRSGTIRLVKLPPNRGAGSDFEPARAVLRRMAKAAHLAAWHRKAHRFVQQNWKAIEMVAVI